MKFNETVLDIDKLTTDAAYLESALNGLDAFIYDRFSDKKVTQGDISALSGMLVAIRLLAKKHAEEIAEYSMKH
ncbi:hypothetical protein [Vagococcus xieshaowenii]|uniref:Uncharacterized protein n=1 Tax=Vagococcus xieshaowenii TaxID=2562451 RepID=A0AAJ5EES8_9ENTE|nr:hypothetical protein [Vagococcus xieshaowenii]QCA29166.1 hypothetical protein E4Z98_07500 [Vagococcus xieshaowenii]TFZ40856.1 hypothetical protein E4031_05590 [Vagococcus xieshaowenii]